jgi:transcriptional regulator with XRE-family HTH domain
VGGGGVSRLTGVDNDDRTTLATELEGGSEARRRPADDDDVAVSLHRLVFMLTHGPEDTAVLRLRKPTCYIRKTLGITMSEVQDVESVVRTRLRSLRTTLGLSLNDLAARADLSPSTISRIETGNRTISLDVLVPLARALQIGLDTLLDTHDDDDVVIRPEVSSSGERTSWMLSRPTANTIALKVRYEPTDRAPEQRTHPGHDWFFVTEGQVRLLLGEREIFVEEGEAAEFDTMTPHSIAAIGSPAELIMVFDRDGHRAHVHNMSPEH